MRTSRLIGRCFTAAVIGSLSCTEPECDCAPTVPTGTIYGTVTRASLPAPAATVTAEARCGNGSSDALVDGAMGPAIAISRRDGTYRLQLRSFAAGVVCVRVVARVAADSAVSTVSLPIFRDPSAILDSARVDLVLP